MRIKAISFCIFSPIPSLMAFDKNIMHTYDLCVCGLSHLTQIPSTRLPEKIKALKERNGERKIGN